MQLNRSKNSIRNSVWGVLNKLVAMFLPFLVRTVLLKKLGEEYLGLSGLFTAILSVLSLTECGFGAAIVYSMYKPIADDDEETLCALLSYYRKIYHIVGLVILVIGTALFPALPHLIRGDYPTDINLYVLYVIYLANTVISYFLFAYETSLLSAYQRNDITSNLNTAVKFITSVFQIIVIFTLRNYTAFVLVIPATTVLNNLFTHLCAKRLFPALKPKGVVSDGLRGSIKKQVVGLFVERLSSITSNSVDHIFISAFIGLTAVAIYSNYYYIIFAVYGFLDVLCVSMQAGIGNSIALEAKEKNYSDFKKFSFLFSWLVSVCTVCVFCLIQSFMVVWVGNALSLPLLSAILFAVYFYSMTIQDICYQYYNANGLWWHSRYRALIVTVVNIVLNFCFVQKFGINGIIIATVISQFIGDIWKIIILFREYFNDYRVFEYVFIILKNIILTLLASFISFVICSHIKTNLVFALLIYALISFLISNLTLLVCNWYTKLFKESWKYILRRFS